MHISNYKSNVYFIARYIQLAGYFCLGHMVVIKMTEHVLDVGVVTKLQRDNEYFLVQVI